MLALEVARLAQNVLEVQAVIGRDVIDALGSGGNKSKEAKPL